jgi:heme-degrading monooxygenase HmoA
MTGVLVRVPFGEAGEDHVTRVAEAARGMFEGLPGLRSKVFTIDRAAREGVNFYVWDTEDAARAFFTPDTLDRIAEAYGARPTVAFLQVAAVVDNATAARGAAT